MDSKLQNLKFHGSQNHYPCKSGLKFSNNVFFHLKDHLILKPNLSYVALIKSLKCREITQIRSMHHRFSTDFKDLAANGNSSRVFLLQLAGSFATLHHASPWCGSAVTHLSSIALCSAWINGNLQLFKMNETCLCYNKGGSVIKSRPTNLIDRQFSKAWGDLPILCGSTVEKSWFHELRSYEEGGPGHCFYEFCC